MIAVHLDGSNNDRNGGIMMDTQRGRMSGRFPTVCFVAGLSLAGSVACVAAGLSLDVTPGLWEISTSGAVSGMPQIPPGILAEMKPEQRVMAQALVLAIIAQASAPHRMQFCVTPQQVRQGLDLSRLGGRTCRQTIQSRSPSGLDMQVACGGEDQMRGSVRLRVLDRSTVIGDVEVREGANGAAAAITQNLHGRWLGASCGNVPPFD
jgi:hypothetical protein